MQAEPNGLPRITDEMVERAASALAQFDGRNPDEWPEHLHPAFTKLYQDLARVALEAGLQE